MKRKLIQLAAKTTVVSLPKKWVDKYNLKKGQEVELKEEGASIRIFANNPVTVSSKTFDISNFARKMIKVSIVSLYKSGYSEIKLTFSNKFTKDLKKDKTVGVMEIIRDAVDSLIGVEIIKQGPGFCVIKEITSPDSNEFDNLLRRIFLLMMDFSKDASSFVKTFDLNDINNKFTTINKFINYCLRILNKYGYKDYKKTSLLFSFLYTLNEILDTYFYIVTEAGSLKKKIGKEALSLFKDTNILFRYTYELFYKFESSKVDEAYKLRRRIYAKMNELKSKSSKQDIVLMSRLAVVVFFTLKLLNLKIAMEV